MGGPAPPCWIIGRGGGGAVPTPAPPVPTPLLKGCFMGYFVLFLILNRWRRLTLVTCNQLALSILKIGFVLAKKARYGEVGRFQHGVPCTWQLPWLAIQKPWLALAGPFLTLLAQQAQEPLPSPCRGTISGLVGSILSGGACAGQTALTIESWLMSGCG